MKCQRVNAGGVAAIVCTGGHRQAHMCGACGSASEYQCDWKTGRGTTCDAHLCARHAQQVGDDKHLCPRHQTAWTQWQAQRSAA